MFDMGFAELLLVAVVGLLVIGPERLPGAIRTTMVWVNRIRRSFDDVRAEVQRELHNDAVMKELRESAESLKKDVEQATEPVQAQVSKMDNELRAGLHHLGTPLDDDTPETTPTAGTEPDEPSAHAEKANNGERSLP